MMIQAKDEIVEVFNFLHDGFIDSATQRDRFFELKIGIPYLSELIHENDEFIFLHLYNAINWRFSPWSDEMEESQNPIEFFELELGIINSELSENEQIILYCDSIDVVTGIDGGTVFFNLDKMEIFDQHNQPVSYDKLRDISNQYWNHCDC